MRLSAVSSWSDIRQIPLACNEEEARLASVESTALLIA